MVQVFLTGLGVLLILASWRWMVVVSLRDSCRDSLRTMRLETVEFFDAHGTAGSHSARRALLDLLDGEIRDLHKLSLLKVALYKHWADNNPRAAGALQAQIMEKFSTNDREVQMFVQEMRTCSAKCIAWYLARRHLTIWLLALAAIPMVVLHQGGKKLSSVFSEAFTEVFNRGARHFKTRGGVQQTIEESFLI
jgi:hypothetical protein